MWQKVKRGVEERIKEKTPGKQGGVGKGKKSGKVYYNTACAAIHLVFLFSFLSLFSNHTRNYIYFEYYHSKSLKFCH